MPRALIYTRFSPRPKDEMENAISTEAQIHKCREYADLKGYQVDGVFSDEGVSRNTTNRPGLLDCVGQVRRGTVVIAYTPDRLGSGYDAAAIEHDIEKRGGAVEYTHDHLNGSDPALVMLRQIMHAQNEFQRSQIGRATSSGMSARTRDGQLMTRPDRCPYGWMVDPDNGRRIVPCEPERAVLDRIRTLRDTGMAFTAIAAALNAEGLTNRAGGRFTRSTVWRMYRNAVRTGVFEAMDAESTEKSGGAVE